MNKNTQESIFLIIIIVIIGTISVIGFWLIGMWTFLLACPAGFIIGTYYDIWLEKFIKLGANRWLK